MIQATAEKRLSRWRSNVKHRRGAFELSTKAKTKREQEYGQKLFARDEIQRMLDAADVQMRAMILIAINDL